MAKKITLIFLIIVLVLIISLIVFLTNLKKQNNQAGSQQLDIKKSTDLSIKNQSKQKTPIIPTTISQSEKKIIFDGEDFRVEKQTKTDQYIIVKKKSGLKTDIAIDQWLNQKKININDVVVIDQANLTPTILTDQKTATPTVFYQTNNDLEKSNVAVDAFFDLFRIFLKNAANPNSQIITPVEELSPTLQENDTNHKKPKNQPAGQYVYYAQCGDGFDNYSLPLGCTVCQAGCGPTTVAMIAASYIDKTIKPTTVVDLYKQKGYYLGCAGSRYTDARSALIGYGLKTTDSLSFSLATIDQAASEFKSYLDTGWTIFVLANFCDQGCGHFFWITAIDKNNNTWAYDPYYGRLQDPPYNEKSRYPFPKYRYAFGVKK